jgi:hypothetical protein
MQVEIVITIMNNMKKHNIIASLKEVFMLIRKSYSNFMYYLKEYIYIEKNWIMGIFKISTLYTLI